MPTTNLPGADEYVLQASISAYADEAYTSAKKLAGTGLVSENPNINTNTETFIGQMRWHKPLNSAINVVSLTDPTDGTPTDSSSGYLTYVKTVRSAGAEKVNMAEVVTRQDGLAKFGRDFANTRAQDEHNAILAILKGVAISEILRGAGDASGQAGLGGQTFENDPADGRYGFYVDLGNEKMVVAPSSSQQGAQRAEGFLHAIGKAWKDYEPEYAYLITSPEVMASLRSANLVDQDGVVDGNITFNTIFQGKFRLLQTRANQSFLPAELAKLNTGVGVDVVGMKTSFIVLPGAVAMNGLTVPVPTEITRRGAAYKGGGVTDIWHRWGYIAHPAGYNWAGSDEAFPSDADYMKLIEGGIPKSILDVASVDLTGVTGSWERKTSSALSLGILPVFHS